VRVFVADRRATYANNKGPLALDVTHVAGQVDHEDRAIEIRGMLINLADNR
jgi:hypothetical protein